MVNDVIEALQDFGEQNLARLDTHLENIRIYDANVLEAEHRSLRELQYEHDDCAGECFDPELSPVVIPPDGIDSDASNADIIPDDVTTPTAPEIGVKILLTYRRRGEEWRPSKTHCEVP